MTDYRRYDRVELQFMDPNSPARLTYADLDASDADFARYVAEYIRWKNQKALATDTSAPSFGPIG